MTIRPEPFGGSSALEPDAPLALGVSGAAPPGPRAGLPGSAP